MPKENEQGTGRHPHKSTEQPWPHHESGKQEASGGSTNREQGRRSENDTGDLKEREYRDAQGNIHHHTRTYEEQHEGGSQAGREGGEHQEKSRGASGSGGENLNKREYRDKVGQ